MPAADLRPRLGAAVRRVRLDRGLTQSALADRLALRRTSVTNIESGVQGLSVDLLVDIASALGTTPQDLLNDALAPADAPPGAGGDLKAGGGVDRWADVIVARSRGPRARQRS